jgi:Baseplate J-like protein
MHDTEKVFHAESLAERARNLGAHGLNGIKLVFVSLAPAGTPTHAFLDVEFHTAVDLAAIIDDIAATPAHLRSIFSITGGTRIPAGNGTGQVRVTQAEALAGTGNVIHLRVEPIGDYSTYTLTVDFGHIDPLFGDIGFKFRPGCFNLNCAPEGDKNVAAPQEPAIDYLAKDYDSFKHSLMGAMMQRVPGWQPTSEADLDQVLIDLVAADADELSDYQDRVMNEAYLATARKRLSLARHARLMDYHIHQGNQAGTWLALKVTGTPSMAAQFGAWAGAKWQDSDSVIFASTQAQDCDALLNQIGLYTWGDTVGALEAGATAADLRLPAPLNAANQVDADTLRNLLRRTPGRYFVLQQILNPETGTVNGRDPDARQLVQLLAGDDAAKSVFDPMTGQWMVRVQWRKEDALTRRYCFVTRCTGTGVIGDVSLFHGNLVPLTQGRPHVTVFRAPEATLAPPDNHPFVHSDEAHYEKTPWGTLCDIPDAPLAYLDTPPGGEHPTRSTLEVRVGGFADPWTEQSDLIESESGDEHFIVETDEYGRSRARFGNDVNGRALPLTGPGATVTCRYRVGLGEAGNVGRDKIDGFDRAANPNVTEIWNPFDVTNGRQPEPVAEIVRRVPEAYRARQLRAVTLEDYARRAEELAEVSRARARYVWTGSWRGVRVAIDPKGGTELADAVRRKIEAHLDAVRLIGEDLEVRPAQFVPLDIHLEICADPDYWIDDLQALLEQEFSDGYTSDGRRGFFHPDEWTFGQPLYASQIIGRALALTGVGRVLSVSIRRLHGQGGAALITVTIDPSAVPQNIVQKLDLQAFEILNVANDPSRLEFGRITFHIQGGRQ